MAYYDLKKKASLTTKEGETETLYPTIVYQRTISADELLRRVEQRCGFKDGMMAGALMEIMDLTAEYLGDGYRMELGEFGYFSGRIKSSKLVARRDDIRSASVRFTGVNFRPSKKFVKQMSKGGLERSPEVRHRQSNTRLTTEEQERILMDHIAQHGFIDRPTYSALTGRLKDVAAADLKGFVERGIIQRAGRGNRVYFVKG